MRLDGPRPCMPPMLSETSGKRRNADALPLYAPRHELDSDPPSTRFPRFVPAALACAGLAVAATVFGSPTAEGAPVAASNGQDGNLLLVSAIAFVTVLGGLFLIVQTALGAQARPGIEPPVEGRLAEENSNRSFERVCWASSLLCNLIALLLVVELSRRLFETPWAVIGVCWIAVFVQFVLFENIARGVALNWADWAMRYLRGPAFVLSAPLRPILGGVLALPALRHPWTEESRARYVRDREMRLLPHVKGVDRLVEEEAVEMIDSVREFAESTAREVVTPRTDLEGVPLGMEREELLRVLRDTSYSRLLVYEENLDNVVGVLLAKEVLLNQPEDPFSLMRPPLVVRHDMPLPDLLRELRRKRNTLAVVVDEYGGTAGIVTLHDLFEQVIGADISDEEDEEELWIEPQGDGKVLLSGRVELWEINQELGLNLDESVARTIGGYLMSRFGEIPSEGDRVPVGEGALVVERVENNRIQAISYLPDEGVPAANRMEERAP